MIRLYETEESKARRLNEHVQKVSEEVQHWNEGTSRPMTSNEYLLWLKEGRDTRKENDAH